jgi:VanZ family protein
MKSAIRMLAVILALLFFVMLFAGGPDLVKSRVGRATWDLGHIPCFALWTWLLLLLRPGLGTRPYWRHCAMLLGVALAAGVLIELLQVTLGRAGRVNDVLLDLLGTLLVLAFLSPARKTVSRGTVRVVQALTAGLLLLALTPLLLVVYDDLLSRRQFPLLSGFETRYEIERWTGNTWYELDRTVAAEGERSLRVPLTTERYSGVSLRYFPRDWRGYSALRFRVRSERDGPLRLGCRIHDETHYERGGAYGDRFTTSFVVVPGWNEISIPLAEVARAPRDRPMDMTRIECVMVFSVSLHQAAVIHLDDVRLE